MVAETFGKNNFFAAAYEITSAFLAA